MKLKIFLPLLFLGLVGCDSLQDGESKQPLSQKHEAKEGVKPAAKSDHDPAVVPHTEYPSIVEVEISQNEENLSSSEEGKKAKQVLDLGKEKIKVYDESMGSVNEASLKKLRDQVK